MIEGLRVAPMYLDAMNEKRVVGSCEECKRDQVLTTRQGMGCGYEPSVSWAAPWRPASGYQTTVCPGWSVTLPQVEEVVGLYPQWKAGYLSEAIGGRPQPGLLECLQVFDVAVEDLKAQKTREAFDKSKGGG